MVEDTIVIMIIFHPLEMDVMIAGPQCINELIPNEIKETINIGLDFLILGINKPINMA